MAESEMTVPRGQRMVVRPHTPKASPLRAWSAADQLVLDHLGCEELGNVLIVNDEFGALSVGLADSRPTLWTDSAASRSAIAGNLLANSFEPLGPRSLPGDEQPTGPFDTVLVRIPKTTAILDYQLGVIASLVTPSTRIVGAGMARHIHRSTLASFEQRLGATTTSRAIRKARLIHVEPARVPTAPTKLTFDEFATDEGLRIAEAPGTFSSGHLDPGSALLLDVMADVDVPETSATVVDLGCGNGVIGATLARRWPKPDFVLTDVSDLAVAAARQTWAFSGLDGRRCRFQVADGLEGIASESADMVITNPPFHQGHALDRDLTDRLLADVARVVSDQGWAFVVVQRHLNVHTRLKRWFSEVETRSRHPTHVVFALKR